MSEKSEYHIDMRAGISVSPVFATLFLMPLLFVASSRAQVNGTPSSVTSPGFGGHPINGTAPSVTSLGPQGYSPNFRFGTPGSVPFTRDHGDGQHRHHPKDNNGQFFGPTYYAVPVPYAVAAPPEDEAAPEDNAEYQGGPTVFDRRGAGERTYVPPVKNAAPAHAAERDDSAPPPQPDPEPEPLQPTLLVFKDGHHVEIENYAIVGSTLIDLSHGRAHKIPLSELDLDATQKQNDDRGVLFQLPPTRKKADKSN